MKAIQVKQPGNVDQLHFVECDIPVYSANDVVIQLKAIGINFIDIYTRTGLYQPPHYPYTPGKEGSGVVTSVGKNVTDFKIGDRVAFCFAGSGSYAEYVVIDSNQVVLVPDDISFELAAASLLQGLTAYYLSHLTFPLNKNHTALIHAGAGGVGLLLIQMAKSLHAKVITTVSTQEKAKWTKDAGADETILYTQELFLKKVNEITNHLGVNVVYDAVGKTTFDDSLKSLALRGMLVSYGQASGPIPPLELTRLSERSLYITRPVLGHYANNKNALRQMASALFSLITSNELKITIGQQYSLKDAAKAHTDLETRQTIGKSILLV